MPATKTETGPSTDAQPAPPPDGASSAAASDELADARPLLLQALALVVATTLVFWLVGAFRDGDGADVAAGGSQDTEQAEGDGATNGIAAEPEADAGEAAAQDAGEEADGDAEAAVDGDETAGDDGDTEGTAAAEDEAPAQEDAEVVTPEGGIAPATISIQVLDAVLNDGGAAAREVAGELEGAGYNVVVINDASVVYDETTVFWSTDSASGAAAQVSDVFGYPRTGAKPSNLSDSVQLHVVVGRDQG